ncbi:MAG TPA: MFS transporter [Dehalococcoidia bacterium]|nr:MFS transporter [Dehalococcoidia bacterium]
MNPGAGFGNRSAAETPPAGIDLRANLRRFYVYRFLSNLLLWLPIWVLYLQRERGLSLSQITALDAPFWLISLIAQVPTGAFADRYGRRTALVVGGLVLAIAYLVFGLASSYPLILASYVLWAIGMAFGQGADLALLYDHLASHGRQEDYPRLAGRAFACTAAAAIVSLAVGAPLAAATRLDVPILATAGISLLTVAVALRLHEPPHHPSEDRPGVWEAMRRGAAEAWHEPHLRWMLLFSSALRVSELAPIIFVQPFLVRHGVSVAQVGAWQIPARVGTIAAALLAYRLVRRVRERRFLLAAPWLFCACFLLLGLWDNLIAFVAFPLFAVASAGVDPTISDYINRHTRAAQRATVLSLGQLLGSLVLAVLEPGLGAIAQAAGLTAAFLTTALFIGAASLLTLGPWALLPRPQVAAEPLATA